MKKRFKPTNLPALTAIFGLTGLILRWCLYRFCLDEKFLIPAGHPMEILLYLFTAGVVIFLIAAIWKLDGSNKYQDNFAPSFPAAVGHILAAAGILLTVLLNEPNLEGGIGQWWEFLGILAPICLVVAGFARLQGKRPFFALHLAPCLFLVFHIVNQFRIWSSDPQIQDYVFTLLGTIALMFFCFYTAAFDVGSGRRRMHLGMGLVGAYLCMVNIATTEYLFLYVGITAWALTDLCTFTPKPKPPKPEPPKESGEST